ncbi:alpha/beta fold hydrolase [Rhodocytophaga rosea]|uniref:Alpha/beta fold hydrolase n=1 Tax=Rhodocytophaga rosea TaxID=2704465 RepID=A0A6C0GRS1_9BACT|nr:alpha/beta fold hydrolase [Rhodocytophaga rosea]QHT70242.1 alpha/beta fold hydrolase [Rhodocytophaga rosea]
MPVHKIDLPYSFIHIFQQEIITEDQFNIHATCYQPVYAHEEVILIGSAIGVHQEYYRAFARFLAGRGYTVYTFDYRGIGKSIPVSLKNLEASMQEWGKYDLDAVIKHIRSTHPNATFTYIGHSISGQILSLTKESSYFSKVVVIASQHMNWRLWPIHLRFTYAFLIYILMPLMSHMLGYYPGKALKIFWDLPKGIALEWARWCRNRKGMFGFHSDHQLSSIQVPLLAIGFSDDAIAPLQPMHALLKKYSQAAVTHWQYSPGELGVKELGHFGFFRAKFKNLLWEPVLDWIEQTERFDKPLMGSLFSNQMECMDVY